MKGRGTKFILSTPTLALPRRRGRELNWGKFQICLLKSYFAIGAWNLMFIIFGYQSLSGKKVSSGWTTLSMDFIAIRLTRTLTMSFRYHASPRMESLG